MSVDRRKVGTMERHFQTIMLTLVASGVLALVNFAWETAKTASRVDERISSIGAQIDSLEKSLRDLSAKAVTKDEHAKDMADARERLADHEFRIRQIENRSASPRPRGG